MQATPQREDVRPSQREGVGPSQRERERRSGGRDVIVEAPGVRDKVLFLSWTYKKTLSFREEFVRGS